MALFGRESEKDIQRAERVRAWATARHPYSLLSVMFGAIAMVDWITIVLGVPSGIAAIVLGAVGRRRIKQAGGLLGGPLCVAGMIMGTIGLLLCAAWWLIISDGA